MKSVGGIALIIIGLAIFVGVNFFHLFVPLILIYFGVKLIARNKGRNCHIRNL